MKTNTHKDQEGFVLVIVAFILLALVGFVALGVDVGVLYSARTSAQEVADAAALAGAFTFVNNPLAPQPATASNHALQVALNNSIMGTPVTASDVTVNVDVVNRRVTVDVDSTQPTYFAKALGSSTADIGVRGIAEAAQNSTGSACVKPWFIPNTAFGTGSDACASCTAGQVLVTGTWGNFQVTPYAMAQIQAEQPFTLRSQSPSQSIAPGQFYAIQLPGMVGGSDYEHAIATCADAYLRCGETYSVETGNMVGPTKQGVSALIGDPADTFLHVGQYQHGAQMSDTSRSVVLAPIWDTCNMAGFCPTGDFGQGTNVNLTIIGFAVIFLDGIYNGDVRAHLINVTACGPSGAGGGGGTTSTGGTVYSLPLRLIRVP